MDRRWVKILTVAVFLLAVALVVYSLTPGSNTVDTAPVAPALLVPPSSAP